MTHYFTTNPHHKDSLPTLYPAFGSCEHLKNPIFTSAQVEHAVNVAPRIKGVFEKAYQAPRLLSHYKVIANVELALANFANPEVKLERLQIAEAALDIYDYLKDQK